MVGGQLNPVISVIIDNNNNDNKNDNNNNNNNNNNKVKNCKRWQAAHLHQPLKTFHILLHWGELFQGSYSLIFELWYSLYIADQDTARYSLCSARENCVTSWAEPLKYMYNRQFVQFALIPVEFVARLWDLSTQKYNNFSIAAVILGYLLLISP